MSDNDAREPTDEEIAEVRTRGPERTGLKKDKPRPFLPADPNRALPSSTDAEMGLICSFLLDPATVGPMCAERRMQTDFFHIPAHFEIWRMISAMWDLGIPLDHVTVTQALHDKNILEIVGGAGMVSNLFMFLPTAANAEHYLEILRDKWTLRELIRTAGQIMVDAYERQDDVTGLLDSSEREILTIRSRLTENRIVMAGDRVTAAIEEMTRQFENKGQLVGLSTGYHEIDEITGGLRNSEMIVLAARPSNGKTALAVNMAEHLAINLGRPVGIFSAEMSTDSLVFRLLSGRAKINLVRWRLGDHRADDFARLTRAGTEIRTAPIFIDDTSAISIQELRGKARIMKQRFCIEALFVDYIQLLTSMGQRARENAQQELTDVSNGLKALAKELAIPIVVLAQVKRDFDERALDGRPRLSDLRGSGSIEQDADVIAFLVREELFAKTTEEAQALEGRATLTFAKQRNGPLGDANLTFLKEFVRFENRAYGDEPDQPRLL